MPRVKENFIPSYRCHKQSGQAIVTLSGKDHLLGPWNSKTSRNEYDRLTAEWLAAGRTLVCHDGVTISELLVSYRQHCMEAYPTINGERSSEQQNIRYALRPLRKLYGATPARDFGPLKLKAVIDEMIRIGWCRKTINRNVGRVKRFFKWCVGNEFLPVSVHQSLTTVEGLRSGRSKACETAPVKGIAEEHAAMVYPFVSRQIKAMIQLQLLTGMRPGEVVLIRGMDLNTTGETWTYTPSRHKTQHLGIEKSIQIGPRAQEILKPFLRPNPAEFLFSPKEADAERRTKLSASRKTPLSCGNVPGSNRQRQPQRILGGSYNRNSYLVAVRCGCEKAFPYPEATLAKLDDTEKSAEARALQRKQWRKEHFWSPNRLRHTAGTNVRARFNVEGAQAILGHSNLRTTEIYAEKNHKIATKIMSAMG
ncbi:MAG: site-specific integrase [Verrucomicrobia bacterium]|nr:site-specific integrase [Verrucomicrobiota bacterium]